VSTVAIKEHYFSSMGEVHSVDVFYTSNLKSNNPCMSILKLAAASDSKIKPPRSYQTFVSRK